MRGSKFMFSCSVDFGKYMLLDGSDGRVLAVLADKQYTAAVLADAAGASIVDLKIMIILIFKVPVNYDCRRCRQSSSTLRRYARRVREGLGFSIPG